MMYVFDFFKFIYDSFIEGAEFLYTIAGLAIDCINSLVHMIAAFPLWITAPFTALLAIAILFRVSQFIPTIGGAS